MGGHTGPAPVVGCQGQGNVQGGCPLVREGLVDKAPRHVEHIPLVEGEVQQRRCCQHGVRDRRPLALAYLLLGVGERHRRWTEDPPDLGARCLPDQHVAVVGMGCHCLASWGGEVELGVRMGDVLPQPCAQLPQRLARHLRVVHNHAAAVQVGHRAARVARRGAAVAQHQCVARAIHRPLPLGVAEDAEEIPEPDERLHERRGR
mmetsp:Transcript_26690/g.74975  ORF Transcript_26690/g.74975 Transcript_26690/m.74975 type:complete len:204 (-) Transcript_26690:315-926(-)